MNPREAKQLETYLNEKFDTSALKVKIRRNADDSAELLHGSEFLGVIYRDEDEGEISFQLNMAILQEDLPAA